ncbi:MAG: threonine--tRNA ligase [Candidatus Absconditabacterales bacterium]
MEEAILKPRHSLSHVLAQAVQRSIDPLAQLGIGPAIDTGFYYDFIFSEGVEFKEENIKELNKMMTKIVKEGQTFHRIDLNYKQAKEIITMLGQEFKIELIEEFKKDGETNFSYYINTIPAAAKDNLLKGSKPEYITKYDKINTYISSLNLPPSTFNLKSDFITFVDMCEGPHVESTKDINADAFKLDKIAGAYWRGNEKNPMMTRIYGLAFEDKTALKVYIEMMEEAKKRDHRILGKQLHIYTFDDEVGAGLPLRLPNGTIIADEVENLAKETEAKYEYKRVRSPHIAKKELYLRSGHLPYYAESMFPPMEMDGETYYLKAMNCPHHHKIYDAEPKSYRDLPLRLAEYGHCYRYEDSGSLFGLMRVRSMAMNDAHIYCTEEQFEDEFMKVVEMYKYYFDLFGVGKYQMRLSTHGKEGLGKKYVDNETLWLKTEKQVRDILVKNKVPFVEVANEAAFYGPKIDVQIWSAIGRKFTLATNQVDFAVPERFNLTFKDKDGVDKTPICIHRAPLSTHERFIGFLLEHFAGAFPLWLAPQQIKIIPVAEIFTDYAKQVEKEMKDKGIRASVDSGEDSFSKKIRNAEIEKIPYIIIVGEKEKTTKMLSIREYRSKKQYETGLTEFVDKCLVEIKTRAL